MADALSRHVPIRSNGAGKSEDRNNVPLLPSGDPELFTLKAARRLAEADLVLFNGLVPSEALKLAPSGAARALRRRHPRPFAGPGALAPDWGEEGTIVDLEGL